MMATTTPFVFAVLLLFLAAQGNCQCHSGTDFFITQAPTGQTIKNKPEWTVTIKNDCSCSRDNIQVYVEGFHSVEEVDPSKLSKITDTNYLLNNGNVVRGYDSVSFNYAWSRVEFSVTTSSVYC
ncbi:uncharacterized protein LOC126659747 [Mercurialis annua]|uniref:uncharacterized protein LOC126659747 n=1 Tax=Mercurialis annua TaxID=3986 RepID=UPI00215E816E|nr:uncharacterized protein LOC126659747 [Mercurialis annua]